MKLQLLSNLLLAGVWMALTGEWSGSGFIVGYLLGLGIVVLMKPFWPAPLYLRKGWATLKLTAIFFRELMVSGLTVISYIVKPKLAIRPGIFAYRTELTSDWEITLLSCLICLTPGTLTLEVSEDRETLYIHAMDMADLEVQSDQIRRTFEKTIMEVTR